MLKLTKYEFRKNMPMLFGLLAGMALLEAWFLATVRLDNLTVIGVSVACVFYSIACFFAVFLLACMNYAREINSKTSFLIFMTPTKPVSVILSKMFTVLCVGGILASLIIGLFFLDTSLLAKYQPGYFDLMEEIQEVLSQFGFIKGRIVLTTLQWLITFLAAFYAQVVMVYFCITLAATLLQSSRFRTILTLVFFGFFTWARYKLENLFMERFAPDITIQMSVNSNAQDVFNLSAPSLIVDLVVIVLLILATNELLKRRLSL